MQVSFKLVKIVMGVWILLLMGIPGREGFKIFSYFNTQAPAGNVSADYKRQTMDNSQQRTDNELLQRLGKGWISTIQYAPDGKYVAVATSIGIELRDPITLAEVKMRLGMPLQGHTGPIGSLAFSPDGSILASGGYDKTIILWKTETGEKLATLHGHQNWVTALAFSKDGTLLASGSYDETVILWDLKAGVRQASPLRTLRGHRGHVLSVAFNPARTLLASGGSDHQVILWDLKALTDSKPAVADDRQFSHKILSGHQEAIQSLAFNPEGSLLVSGSDDASVILWDVKKGEKIQVIRDHQDAVKSVAFNPAGTFLASGSFDGTVRLWSISQLGREPAAASKTLQSPAHHIWWVTFSPDGHFLLSSSAENRLVRWDLQNGDVAHSTPTVVWDHTSPLWSSAISQKTLALAGDNGMLELWNLTSVLQPGEKNGKREEKSESLRNSEPSRSSLQGHLGAVRTVAFNREGTLLASGGEDKQIILWDAQNGVKQRVLEGHGGSVLRLAFSPDDAFLASGGDDQMIFLWDLQTGEKVKTLWNQSQDVLTLVFSPDGKVLISAGSDGTIIFWDIEQGEPIHTLTRPGNWMSSLALSPDGELLAIGNLDNSVTLWSISDNREVRTLRGPTGPIWSLAFSPDGSRLAGAGSDSIIFLWTVNEGQLFKTLRGHTSWVNCLSFNQDGSLLISGSFDGTALIWRIDRPETLQSKGLEAGFGKPKAERGETKKQKPLTSIQRSSGEKVELRDRSSDSTEVTPGLQNPKTEPEEKNKDKVTPSPKDKAISPPSPSKVEEVDKEKSDKAEKIKADPESIFQKWYELGLARMAQRRWESAIENLKRALEVKQVEEVKEKLKEAIHHRWYDLGMERMKQKRWEDAIENFNLALSTLDTPESRKGLQEASYHKWYEAGLSQAERGLWSQAGASFTLALGFLDTEEARTHLREVRYAQWYQTGLEQVSREQWARARESFRLALQEKDTEEARRQLQQAIINQNYQEGQIRLQQQNWSQAIAYFTQALSELKNSQFPIPDSALQVQKLQVNLYYAQGSLAMDQQDWTEARKLFEKALEVDPHHSDARRKLNQIVSFITRQKQEQIQPLLRLGEEKLKEWDWDAARTYFLKAWEINPADLEISQKLEEVATGLRYWEEDQQRERQLLRAQQEHQMRSLLEKEIHRKNLIRYTVIGLGILGSLLLVLILRKKKSFDSLTQSKILEAAFYKTLGRYAKAAEIYQRMLEKDLSTDSQQTDKLWIYPLLADLYIKMGRQDEEAAKVYDRALSLGFTHPEAIIPVSYRYLRNFKISERALWVFENALKIDPYNRTLLNAILLKAWVLLPENPGHFRFLSLFLKACEKTNTLAMGIDFLREIIPIDPSFTDLYLKLADLFWAKGKPLLAKEYLTLAYKFNKNAPSTSKKGNVPSHTLGVILDKLEAIYRLLTTENGQAPAAHYQLGLLYMKQGKIRKAIREFRKIHKIPQWRERSRNKLMECWNTLGATRILLSLRPSNLKIRFYTSMGAWDRVIRVYERLLSKNPKKVWIFPRLSALYLKTGRFHARAFWVHHKALSLDPELRDPALLLANYYLQRRMTGPRTIWVYERALEFQPDNVELLSLLLEAYLKADEAEYRIREDHLSKEQAMVTISKRLYRLGHRSKRVYQILSRSCLKHQRIDREAMHIYQNALQYEPDNQRLRDMIDRVRSLQEETLALWESHG
ncbi:MAG TPA: tetratricopeptide repeat protein [Candidatus Limnocylindrales bacterium]|nr:tetratricopeptide repeat protein [Candidatus Limnocylindrales bacterium]